MGDGLEAMRRDSTTGFCHYNHLRTTHQLTDAGEDVTDTYRHDAWGVLAARPWRQCEGRPRRGRCEGSIPGCADEMGYGHRTEARLSPVSPEL